ncbi:MAG TPA: helix-turn-helix domain-containing protein [Candidatus Acidoferrales bacterium]|nr:helix-turn-helix domain-containing protein [Candidatus Acidoferrales bacterium]
MRTYSISDAAKLLEIDRTTLRRWLRKKKIPVPTPGIIEGRLSKCWTEDEMAKIIEHKATGYWGKGINRKTGKRAKRTKK